MSSLRQVLHVTRTPLVKLLRGSPQLGFRGGQTFHTLSAGCVRRSRILVIPDHQLHTTTTMSSLVKCSINSTKECLEISWKGGQEACYPFLWLRDACLCPQCFDSMSKGRLFLMTNLDPDTQIVNTQVDEDKGLILVTWSCGHVSPYPFTWLEERGFTDQWRTKLLKLRAKPARPWASADLQGDKLPVFQFNKLISDDQTLYHWLEVMAETGLALIRDAPTEIGQTEKLVNRVAHWRTTNYGVYWTVKAKTDNSSAAYTSKTLGLHTDLPFYSYIPGVQMMHCVKQARNGGGSLFVDGYQVALQVRDEHPQDYDILTRLPVEYYDIGKDYYKFHFKDRKPVIGLNKDGEPEVIVFNNQARAWYQTVPLEHAQALYRALKLFNNIMYDPHNLLDITLRPGDIICFDNKRVLHGRTGFEVEPNCERHLEGGYLDWDEMEMRRRVLEAELGLKEFKSFDLA